MEHKLNEGRIRELKNTMELEGFMMTEAEVRDALTDYYASSAQDEILDLIERMKDPNFDASARIGEIALKLANFPQKK
jgi:hypothetical protein